MATDYNNLIKSNFVRLVVLLLLFMLSGIVAVGLFTDKHINLWVVEFNGNKNEPSGQKHDTVYVKEPVFQRDTDVINQKTSYNPPFKTNKTRKTSNTTKKVEDTSAKIAIENKGINEGVMGQKNVNNGTNNGVIGDNNNIFGKIKSHPTDQLINQIESSLPDKEEVVNIMALTTGAGSYDFAVELKLLMEKRGYKKIGIGTGQMAPVPNKGVTLDKRRGEQTLLVNVD